MLILSIIGAAIIAIGIIMLRTKEKKPDIWLWMGHGEDPFKAPK
jgi:hypothetical protein